MLCGSRSRPGSGVRKCVGAARTVAEECQVFTAPGPCSFSATHPMPFPVAKTLTPQTTCPHAAPLRRFAPSRVYAPESRVAVHKGFLAFPRFPLFCLPRDRGRVTQLLQALSAQVFASPNVLKSPTSSSPFPLTSNNRYCPGTMRMQPTAGVPFPGADLDHVAAVGGGEVQGWRGKWWVGPASTAPSLSARAIDAGILPWVGLTLRGASGPQFGPQ